MRRGSLPAPEIPRGAEALTPDWLTAVLRARGVLREARVTHCAQQALGAGEGFVGEIVRLELELDQPEEAAPRSIVAKLPTRLVQNRRLGEALGAYEREVRFYEELADRFEIRKPRCYHAAMDRNPLEGREEAILDFFERLPLWAVRILVPLGMWLASRSRRRYVLLLEDLSAARCGDQVTGCSLQEAGRALRSLASAHAGWWEREELGALAWVPRFDALRPYAHVLYRKARPAFFQGLGAGLGSRFEELGDWLDRNGMAVMERIGAAPATLVHGDYRLDNLFFDDAPAGPGVVAVDWQSISRGPGAFDVAYFLTGNLAEAPTADDEDALVGAYHARLVERGVEGYPLDACTQDYELSKLYIAYRMIVGADAIDFATPRGAALIRGWLQRLVPLLPERWDELLRAPSPGSGRRGATSSHRRTEAPVERA